MAMDSIHQAIAAALDRRLPGQSEVPIAQDSELRFARYIVQLIEANVDERERECAKAWGSDAHDDAYWIVEICEEFLQG